MTPAEALAKLGDELSALIGPERGAAARLAGRIGYSRSTVVHVSHGDDRPSRALVLRLADALGVDDATRDRWLDLAGHAEPEPDVEPVGCATLWCSNDAVAPGDVTHPFRSLCELCRRCARDRMKARRITAAEALESLVVGGKLGKASACVWCARPAIAGHEAFERAPGGGAQCRVGQGCAREARAA